MTALAKKKLQELKLKMDLQQLKTFQILKVDHLNVGAYILNSLAIDKVSSTEEALIEIEKESHEFFNIYGKNFIYYTLDKDETKELFTEFLEMSSEKDPSNVADLYAFRGDYDLSFEYLNKALEVKDPVLLEALTYPSFDPMRSDSRWDELIDKMKLPKNHGYK